MWEHQSRVINYAPTVINYAPRVAKGAFVVLVSLTIVTYGRKKFIVHATTHLFKYHFDLSVFVSINCFATLPRLEEKNIPRKC